MARRRQQQTRTITAAASRIKLKGDGAPRGRSKLAPKEWQSEGWAYFDEVPEIKYSVRFLGNAFAKLRIFAAVLPVGAEPDADPIPISDEQSDVPTAIAQLAELELGRLRSIVGGRAALQSRMNMNLEVAGEFYLAGFGEREQEGDPGDPTATPPRPPSADYKPATAEEWLVCSVNEVEVKGGRWFIKQSADDKKGRELDLPSETSPGRDTIIRIWEQHPAWMNDADSAMRGVLNDCKALQVLSQQQYAESLSRQSAGVLLVPNELSTGPAMPTEPEDDGAPTDPFTEELMVALTSPIEDPSSASSVMPMVVRGPSEALKEFRQVHIGRDSSDTLDKRIEARIQRIARGLNLPVEVVMGHQQTTYANAEQVDQDTFEDHLEPRCRLMVDALTVGFLRPQLEQSNVAPDVLQRIVVWYDASALIRQPDTDANAGEAFDRFAISDEAYRRHKGFTEDDAPDPIDIIIRAGLRRGILTAELTAALLKQLADEAGVELPAAPAEIAPDTSAPPSAAAAQLAQVAALLVARQRAKSQPKATARQRDAITVTSSTRPRWNPGVDLVAFDRDLRTRLHVAAESAMTRALERAGARLRTKANGMRTMLRTVDNVHVACTMGSQLALQAATHDELIGDDTWDALEEQFMSWAGQTQSDVLDVVSRATVGLSTAERATLQLRQAGDLSEAWSWMRDALTALAGQRMFDPDPAAPALGEFDPAMRVPPGLIRQSMSRAGGASGLITTDKGGAFVTLADGGTRPAGGIGTGELVRETLRDHGVPLEGYRWVYGPAMRKRPFDPHRELDGTEFVNFDDDVLANRSGWPEFAFYLPGDHDGCLCDVEPIIIPVDEA